MCECDIPKRYKKRLLPLNPANDQMPIYNNATGKWELINKADIGGSGSTAFNGNRAIKRSPFVGLNVGGANVVDFLNNFFFPAIDPSFALTNAGTNYFEKGFIPAVHAEEDPYNLLYSVQGSVVPQDATNIEYRLYNATTGTAYPDNTAAYTPYTGAFAVSLPALVYNNNDAYQIQLRYQLNGVTKTLLSAIKYRQFVWPYWFGMANGVDLPTTGPTIATKTLTKRVMPIGASLSLTFNGTDKPMVLIYPDNYPNLTSIKDPNNFEMINSFTKVTGNVTGIGDSGNQTGGYKLYFSNITTVNNGTFTFYF